MADIQETASALPHVEEGDFLARMMEEVTDPGHLERWQHFSSTNPELMHELLVRAQRHESPDVTKVIVDEVTWALGALEQALERTAREASDLTPADLDALDGFAVGDQLVLFIPRAEPSEAA